MIGRTQFVFGLIGIFLVVCGAAAQEPAESTPERLPSESQGGQVEFGVRSFWGNVYGRPDLPFKPDLATAKLNEYSDIRKNLYVRRALLNFNDVFGKNNYFQYQTQSTLYKNQSHLATFGQ